MEESLLLLLGVFVTIGLTAIKEVVGDVVVRGQAVSRADAFVDEVCHMAVEIAGGTIIPLCQLFIRDGTAELHVYTTLRLNDAGKNTVEVFAWFLDVRPVPALIEFQRLENIARLPLVGNRYRYDVELGQSLDFVARITHAKHLDNTLIRAVDTIFRAPVALGYPYRLMLIDDDMTHVLRQMARSPVELAGIAARPLYTEHLVRLSYINDQRTLHQVGTESNLRGFETIDEPTDIA